MFYLCNVRIICLCVGVECVVINVVWIGEFFVGNVVCRWCMVVRKLWNGFIESGLVVCVCLLWWNVFRFFLCDICLFLLLKIIVLLLKVICSCLLVCGGVVLGRIVVVVIFVVSVWFMFLVLVDRNRLVLNGVMQLEVGVLLVNVVWLICSLQCWMVLKMCSFVLFELCDSRIIFIGGMLLVSLLRLSSFCISGKVMFGLRIFFLCLIWKL